MLGSLHWLAPEFFLAGTLLGVVLASILGRDKFLPALISLFGVLGASVLLLLQSPEVTIAWEGMLILDQWGRWTRGVLLFTAFIILLWTARHSTRNFSAEYYILTLALLLGTLLMVMAGHLLFMYLSLELVSISSYLLTLHLRTRRVAAEAAMKYLLFGAFSSALMLYGISWVYGLGGGLDLNIAATIEALAQASSSAQMMAMGLIIAGLLFKIAAVPMHFWAPDVYQGTSYPVATFFSIAPKAGGLLMLLHLLSLTEALPIYVPLQILLLLVAVASMTLGNLAALWQTDLKRLLAYSSVAQSGFMLIAAACRSVTGDAAVVFYLTVYVLMNLCVFILAAALSRIAKSDEIDSLDGLAFRYPMLTIAITIGLVALVGLPPTAGFIAKWYVLMAGIEQVGAEYTQLWVGVLALAVINTVISLFYYLRIPARMVLRTNDSLPEPMIPLPRWAWLGISMALPVLLLGFLGFDEVMNWIQIGFMESVGK